jgi:hypothetical protein
MTDIDLSRQKAFDIANFFAPEIINPNKAPKRVLMFSDEFPDDDKRCDMEYKISKLLDYPVDAYYAIPRLVKVFPRGIPWHNFPVVADPHYRIDACLNKPSLKWDGLPAMENSKLLRCSKMNVFLPVGTKREAAEQAYELGYLLNKYNDQSPVAVVDDRLEPATTDVAALKLRMATEMRFRYSYEINFKAIALKAFRQVGAETNAYSREEDWPWKDVRFSRPLTSRSNPNLADPLALQWLFKLRRIGEFNLSYAYKTLKYLKSISSDDETVEIDGLLNGHPAAVTIMAKRKMDGCYMVVKNDAVLNETLTKFRDSLADEVKMPVILKTVPPDVFNDLKGNVDDKHQRFFALEPGGSIKWMGTGKYKPYPISDQMADAATKFVHLGLVEFDNENETLSLSDKGNRLLDILHPDCEDPDVMLRWTENDGFFKPDCEKSCDDWIMRFFSKMKTKVNEI